MQLVIISGLSGSGKSVALNVMEDSGHYVVDNLPSALLPQLVTHLRGAGYQRIAVAIDVRSGSGIAALPRQLETLRGMVRDVRCLPNPHYDPVLRPLTGRDQPVIDFLERVPEVGRMVGDIYAFVASWLPSYVNDNRSYLTVAIGCTGGQHRSVYIAEQLAERLRDSARVLVRHRSFK